MSGIPLEPIIVVVGFWTLAVNVLGAAGYIDYVTEHKCEWHNAVLFLCALLFPLNWTYIFFFLVKEFKIKQTEKIKRKDKKKKAIEECKNLFQKQSEKTREILQAQGLLKELFHEIETFDYTFSKIERLLNAFERNLLYFIIKNNITLDCDDVINFTSECYRIFMKNLSVCG